MDASGDAMSAWCWRYSEADLDQSLVSLLFLVWMSGDRTILTQRHDPAMPPRNEEAVSQFKITVKKTG